MAHHIDFIHRRHCRHAPGASLPSLTDAASVILRQTSLILRVLVHLPLLCTPSPCRHPNSSSALCSAHGNCVDRPRCSHPLRHQHRPGCQRPCPSYCGLHLVCLTRVRLARFCQATNPTYSLLMWRSPYRCRAGKGEGEQFEVFVAGYLPSFLANAARSSCGRATHSDRQLSPRGMHAGGGEGGTEPHRVGPHAPRPHAFAWCPPGEQQQQPCCLEDQAERWCWDRLLYYLGKYQLK